VSEADGSLAYGTVYAIAIPEPAAWAWGAAVVAGVVWRGRRMKIRVGITE